MHIIKVNWESLTETTFLRYLGIDTETFGGMKEEIEHWVVEGESVSSSLRELRKKLNLSSKIKMNLFECMSVPSVMWM